jgi:hypothetical protein
MKHFLVASLMIFSLAGAARADVNVVRTPDRGIQPQALMDAQGNLHLLYFQGDPKAGNLFYVRRDADKSAFGRPLKVNSQDGSAIAVGSIRGGHLALGKNGRVHVSWNGSGKAEPKNPIMGTPMLCSRLDDAGNAFEPQRNLMTKSAVLDGGGSLAADTAGNVYVAWHGLGAELVKGEGNRKLWVSVSTDEGRTFAAEKPAWGEPTGACGCCGVRGFVDSKGDAYFLYRAASEKINRGMYLLRSIDQGKTFAGTKLDNWKITSCPMSSEAFAEGPSGVVAAWDNEGQMFVARMQSGKLAGAPTSPPGGDGNRQHPALAVNKDGAMILVWVEGAGWNRGGALAWQFYDKGGNPTSTAGRRAGAIPVWGLPSAVAEADGNFTIFH